ncbi:protein-L-isoaspartate O-methyltransferase [Puccinia triticina 1-1 BBBD Race 1]|uniref:protein-L-isoaspartate(D-aspartate) O-methyltransferase n=2 Tax=Puccinia triticina TaxID=208348 RepID=A0A180GRF6_PUCT1|nr:uncharacterized protein PtA15_14A56 [Puccinia triticina]OAV94969.1 protein-L-isoaspartate O-methyltransferase [Puccinia triticina 1-1 BBBD Race 1]WAQ91175.1 hypothetical protein PtA15_14A56 [Puccinia triticina]WAR61975.1 hypothetical protein PtB15_14B68 [Puccinia triticina]
MAWRSHGATNNELVQNLFANGLMKSTRVLEAMKHVDRANYLLPGTRTYAYEDRPRSIGFGATISAPHMHANALENLLPFLKPGARVLDVGSGSGYMLACFHHLVKGPAPNVSPPTIGFVLGIEHIPELAIQSIGNLRKDGLGPSLDNSEISVCSEDGRNPDPRHGGAWDVIHVGAAAPTVPESLLNQLNAPGRMFIPVGEDNQAIYQIDKHSDGSITQHELYGVRYVPLTSLDSQLQST